MIVYEASGASGRAGRRGDLGGRRVAGRLLPYGAEASAAAFDPLDRRFLCPGSSPGRGRALATGALARGHLPAPFPARCSSAAGPPTPGRGAGRVSGGGRRATLAGAGGLPAGPGTGVPSSVAGAAAVVLCTFGPEGASAFPGLDGTGGRASACAVLFPLIPGWTAEEDAVAGSRGGRRRRRSGRPRRSSRRGTARRAGPSSRPGRARADDRGRVLRGDPPRRMARRLAGDSPRRKGRFRARPPRPAAAAGRPGRAARQRAAASRLEERAELEGCPSTAPRAAGRHTLDRRDPPATSRPSRGKAIPARLPFRGERGVGRSGARPFRAGPHGEPPRPGSTSTFRIAPPAAATARSWSRRTGQPGPLPGGPGT